MRIEGLMGRGTKSLKALVLLPFAFLKTAALLVRLRPALVIGVGGFSSGPVILLASWLRRPTIILEQNVRPGFTNRLLSRWADKAVTAFESSRPYFRGKGIWLGNPVREAFSGMEPKTPGETIHRSRFRRESGIAFPQRRRHRGPAPAERPP